MDKLCVKFPDDVKHDFEFGKPIVLLGPEFRTFHF